MNKNDVGSYFIKKGYIYLVVQYENFNYEVITLRNIHTGEEDKVIVGSEATKEYSKLFKVSSDEDGNYNLDKATPVKGIFPDARSYKKR